ncbi:uncharacterized protein [Periplaneta americana]|uniref:uncharacterized protein isoform X2 n=1 Tax=Periplaneta americana TaxID=6978 RepID=UPI0037E7DA28
MKSLLRGFREESTAMSSASGGEPPPASTSGQSGPTLDTTRPAATAKKKKKRYRPIVPAAETTRPAQRTSRTPLLTDRPLPTSYQSLSQWTVDQSNRSLIVKFGNPDNLSSFPITDDYSGTSTILSSTTYAFTFADRGQLQKFTSKLPPTTFGRDAVYETPPNSTERPPWQLPDDPPPPVPEPTPSSRATRPSEGPSDLGSDSSLSEGELTNTTGDTTLDTERDSAPWKVTKYRKFRRKVKPAAPGSIPAATQDPPPTPKAAPTPLPLVPHFQPPANSTDRLYKSKSPATRLTTTTHYS